MQGYKNSDCVKMHRGTIVLYIFIGKVLYICLFMFTLDASTMR